MNNLVKKQTRRNVAGRNGRHPLMQKKIDLRSQRTRIFIQNALIDLIERRGFDHVSVQDISAQAMINRATFYRYYRDKHHVVEEIFKDALQRMANEMGPPLIISESGDLARGLDNERNQAAWVSLFEHFASNGRMYRAMLGGKGCVWFQSRMKEHLKRFLSERVSGRHQGGGSAAVPVEVARCFFASAILGVVQLWLEGGRKHSALQVATWFRRIAFKGYIGALAGMNE